MKAITGYRIKLIVAASLGITGLILLGWFVNWQAALAVFLMIWSNNMSSNI